MNKAIITVALALLIVAAQVPSGNQRPVVSIEQQDYSRCIANIAVCADVPLVVQRNYQIEVPGVINLTPPVQAPAGTTIQ